MRGGVQRVREQGVSLWRSGQLTDDERPRRTPVGERSLWKSLGRQYAGRLSLADAVIRLLYTLLPTPVGDLLLTSNGEALTGAYFVDEARPLPIEPAWRRDDGAFGDVVSQLRAYFGGDLQAFDVALAPRGTPFQQRVWSALQDIPYGTTSSYGKLAVSLGASGAARAVGLANGRNPISIIIPCHRVIGADGRLTGYGGGLPRKHWLLALEGRALPFG